MWNSQITHTHYGYKLQACGIHTKRSHLLITDVESSVHGGGTHDGRCVGEGDAGHAVPAPQCRHRRLLLPGQARGQVSRRGFLTAGVSAPLGLRVGVDALKEQNRIKVDDKFLQPTS